MHSKNRFHVLAAIDQSDNLDMILDLVKKNYGDTVTVVPARDGLDATSKVYYQSFNCIIVDADLTKKNFGAVINAIRQSPMNNSTPIIVLYQNQKPEMQNDGFHVHCCPKPIDPEKLLELTSLQLALGRGNERLSTLLLNSIAKSLVDLLRAAAKGDYAVNGPFLTLGQDCFSKQNIILHFSRDKSKTKLFISLCDKTTRTLRSSQLFVEELEDTQIAKSLALMALKRSAPMLKNAEKLKSRIEIGQDDVLNQFRQRKGVGIHISDEGHADIQIFVVPEA